jgi:threonine dehydrogenase-like Zn-dependent dehydrogenase
MLFVLSYYGNPEHKALDKIELITTSQWKWLTRPIEPGQVGGHEGVGHVVKIGEGVTSDLVEVNDRTRP